MPEFELVLPCYGEARSLAALLDRAVGAATAAGFTSQTFRLVLVENGSRDDSARVLGELATGPQAAWLKRVDVAVNRGYGLGVWAGLKATTAPFVAWSHADQQCDPADAFRGLELLRRGGGERRLVKGVRQGRNWKDVAVSRVFESVAQALLGMSCPEINAQPKVFPRALLDEVRNPPPGFAFDLYVLYRALKAGYRIETIPVQFPPRVHGLSNWASTFRSRRKTIAAMVRYIAELAMTEGRL